MNNDHIAYQKELLDVVEEVHLGKLYRLLKYLSGGRLNLETENYEKIRSDNSQEEDVRCVLSFINGELFQNHPAKPLADLYARTRTMPENLYRAFDLKDIDNETRGDPTMNKDFMETLVIVSGALLLYWVWHNRDKIQDAFKNTNSGNRSQDGIKEVDSDIEEGTVLCLVVPTRKMKVVIRPGIVPWQRILEMIENSSYWLVVSKKSLESVERGLHIEEYMNQDIKDGQDIYYRLDLGRQPMRLQQSKSKYTLKNQLAEKSSEANLDMAGFLQTRKGLEYFEEM